MILKLNKPTELIVGKYIFKQKKNLSAGFYTKYFMDENTLNNFYKYLYKYFNITKIDDNGDIYIDNDIKLFKPKFIDGKFFMRIKYNEYYEYN